MNAGRGAALLTLGGCVVALTLPSAFTIIESTLLEPCAEHARIPVLQLGGEGEIARLLVAPETACRAQRIEAAHIINRIDIALFVPAYALMLSGAARVLAGRWMSVLGFAAIAAALGAGACDFIETLAQLRVTGAGADMAARIAEEAPTILVAARVKYAFLALNAACLAGLAFVQRPMRPIIGALGAAPIIAAGALVYTGGASELAFIGFGLYWLALLVVAVRSVRASSS